MTPRFLISLLAPYRARLALLTAVLLVESGVALTIPWVGGRLGAQVLAAPDVDRGHGWLLAAVIGLLAALGLLKALSSWMHVSVAETILADLRLRFFAHVQALPLPWHLAAQRGDLIAMLTIGIERLGGFISGTLVRLLPLVLTAVGALVLMFRIDPVLATLVPILVPGFFVGLRLVGRYLRRLAARIQTELAAAVSRFEEMLDLVPIIKSFRAEGYEYEGFARQVGRVKEASLAEARVYSVFDPAVNFLVSVSVAVLLVLAGQGVRSGSLTPAETVSFLMYVALLVRPVSQLASVYGQVQTARGTLARLQDVLKTAPEAVEGPRGLPRRPAGTIRFENVCFAYPERGAAVSGLSFEARAGETVALVGENGAGKTTAMGLLMGFFRPQAGRILLDGIDIATMPLAELRGAIGYVPQSRHLRNASLRDNIAFGAPEVPLAQVEAAARTAQAHDFITALPQGYATLVGDKGVKLSGGQQQRIALARALLKDPPILILDEATSMFDLAGEAAFVAECQTALAGRTVILITHRPASLAVADRILTIEKGRITRESAPSDAAG